MTAMQSLAEPAHLQEEHRQAKSVGLIGRAPATPGADRYDDPARNRWRSGESVRGYRQISRTPQSLSVEQQDDLID